MDHPCRGCVDAVMDPSGVGGYLCEYMDHNGHSRMLICPPGAQCTVKSTVPRDAEEVRPERRYEATAGGGRRTCCWDQKLANADRIRAMSDDALADFIARIAYGRETPWSKPFLETFCHSCPAPEYTLDDGRKMELHECDFVDGECPHGSDIVWWLNQPCKEDDHARSADKRENKDWSLSLL